MSSISGLPEHERGARQTAMAATALYAGLLGYLTWIHVLWGDEAQQWLIARASHGLGELYLNRRYEGHPILWYLVLYPFAHLSDDIDWIKLPVYIIAVTACYVTCRYFLTGWLEKALFPFGVLMIFYYGVMTRPYMLGYLLILLVCLCLRANRRLAALLLIGVLANIHLYFLIIAGGLLIHALWAFGVRFANRKNFPRAFWLTLAATCLLFMASIAQILPPSAAVYLTPDYRPETLWNIPRLLGLAVSPVLANRLGPAIPLIVFLGLIAALYRMRLEIGLFAALTCGALLLFESLIYGGGAWHAGMVTLTLYAAVFLLRQARHPVKSNDPWLYSGLFAVLLGFQFASTVKLLPEMLTTPLSEGKEAARFLEAYCPECPLVADQPSAGPSLSAYLGGKPIYYVNRRAFGTYQRLDGERFQPHGVAETAAAARQFHNPILILGQAATPDQIAQYRLMSLRSFTGGVAPEERYFVYIFLRDKNTIP